MLRVFISYSHDSEEHASRVAALVQQLRDDGVTIVLDRDMLPGGPAEGWPQWSERQVKEADIVLVACTGIYSERYEGNQPPGQGLGAVCEAGAIRQFIYDHAGVNERIRVLLFDAADQSHIPTQLKRYHAFQPAIEESYASLLSWLRGMESTPAPVAIPPRAIAWPMSPTDYSWPLADRKDELAYLDRMITGHSVQRILLLRGDSNSGKTVLLTELLGYAQHLQLPTALFDFKGCPSLDDLFDTLRLDLGPEILPLVHASSGIISRSRLIADLQQLTSPLVLAFDTYEQASTESQRWLESQLLPRLVRAPGVVIIIGGQNTPDRTKYSWRALSESCHLQPIRKVEDWRELINKKWQGTLVKEEHIVAILVATKGDPGNTYAVLKSLEQQLQTGNMVT